MNCTAPCRWGGRRRHRRGRARGPAPQQHPIPVCGSWVSSHREFIQIIEDGGGEGERRQGNQYRLSVMCEEMGGDEKFRGVAFRGVA